MASWREILSYHTPQEIYNGVKYVLPAKIGKTPVQDYEKPYRIVAVEKRSMPLKMNSYIVNKFLTGEWNPRPQTIRKIKQFDYWAKYGTLREAGASQKQARTHARENWDKVEQITEKFRHHAARIASWTGTDPFYVQWGMSQSPMPIEDYDRYPEEI